jgi:hypothetical protein
VSDTKVRRPAAAALAAVVASLTMLTAACGASGGAPSASATTAKPATYQQMIAYAQCIRSHGAPEFPDPVQDQFGNWAFLSSPGSGVNGPGVPAAENACKKMQPVADKLTGQQQQEMVSKALKLAICMRAHGITNFPDPSNALGGVTIDLHGLDPKSPQFQAAQQACRQYRLGPRTRSAK